MAPKRARGPHKQINMNINLNVHRCTYIYIYVCKHTYHIWIIMEMVYGPNFGVRCVINGSHGICHLPFRTTSQDFRFWRWRVVLTNLCTYTYTRFVGRLQKVMEDFIPTALVLDQSQSLSKGCGSSECCIGAVFAFCLSVLFELLGLSTRRALVSGGMQQPFDCRITTLSAMSKGRPMIKNANKTS